MTYAHDLLSAIKGRALKKKKKKVKHWTQKNFLLCPLKQLTKIYMGCVDSYDQ